MDETIVIVVVPLSKWIHNRYLVSDIGTAKKVVEVSGDRLGLKVTGVRVNINQHKVGVEYLEKVVVG